MFFKLSSVHYELAINLKFELQGLNQYRQILFLNNAKPEKKVHIELSLNSKDFAEDK